MRGSLMRRSMRLAAAGAMVLATFGFTGQADAPSATGTDVCDGEASAARAMRGTHGVDPNSLTATEAKASDARLRERVRHLVGAGVLGRDGTPARSAKITVRTHVHVITASDGTGGVTGEQIRDQIQVLNDALAGRTAQDSARSPFSFKLASVDVTRNDKWHDWNLKPDGTEDKDAIKAKTALHRGGWGDLNIYIAALGDDLLGYATFPQAGILKLDGLVLLNESLPGGSAAPYNEGDTATHEVGHWLGLYHTFENSCTFPGDYVHDTPYQFEGDNIFFCNEADDTCPQPGSDPVHNFMSYGDDPCLDSFTWGQSLRMTLTWLAYRA
jgi:Pregnancy-associated plasma protein-A